MAKLRLKKGVKRVLLILFLACLLTIAAFAVRYYLGLNKKLTPIEKHGDYYIASDFGINVIKSDNDFDGDGLDDYSDILLGAQKERDNNPTYVNDYYDGGYPPENEGVCTDTIWRALNEAGYNLKNMINQDIIQDQKAGNVRYNIENRDSNIDFRRVQNQEVFFDTYLESLTTDIYDIEEFMPGDIVVFNYSEHIAIISNKRNENGIPYLIHNFSSEQKEKEEDILETTEMVVTGHYRFKYERELQRIINKI